MTIDTENDPRDLITRQHWPVVPVPRYGELPPLAESAHRVLIAQDTVALEIRRPWLHAVLDLCDTEGLSMLLPYGDVEPKLQTAFNWDDEAVPLINRFIDEAHAAAPREHAAWLVWDAVLQQLVYAPLLAIQASAGGISYHRRQLEPYQSLAIDLHSHGHLDAFFSATDDEDDAGAVKIAGVVGNLDVSPPTWCFRISALGLFSGLDIDETLRCRRCGCTNANACSEGCFWMRPGLCSRCAS